LHLVGGRLKTLGISIDRNLPFGLSSLSQLIVAAQEQSSTGVRAVEGNRSDTCLTLPRLFEKFSRIL
jgi:hypothetical protein